METKEKRPFLFGIPPFALAVITAVISFIFLFAIGYPLNSLKFNGFNIGDWVAYISTGILIAVACFFICREYPKSLWYVLVICNALGILSAVVESSFWVTDLWKQNLCVWVLSILAAIIGTMASRKGS